MRVVVTQMGYIGGESTQASASPGGLDAAALDIGKESAFDDAGAGGPWPGGAPLIPGTES